MHNYDKDGGQNSVDVNRQVIESYIDYASYNIFIPAALFATDSSGAAIATPASQPGGPHYLMPDSVGLCILRAGVRRPDQWLSGRLNCIVHYAFETTGAGNVVVGVVTHHYKDGDIMTAIPGTATENTIASPVTAYKKATQSFTNNEAIDSSITWIGATIYTDGGDAAQTYTDDFVFYGLELQYTETKRIIGIKQPS